MKKALYLLFSLSTFNAAAQLSRYPYVQNTTPYSTIIAFKTPQPATGSVAFGTSPGVTTDSLYETGAATTRHALTLGGLQPNTVYYYRIYANGVLQASEYFKTANDSSQQQFSFIQYGDCGFNSSMQQQIGALMEADNAEFAVVCGDIDQGGVPHVSSASGGDNYDDVFFNVYNNGTSTKMLSRECHYTAIGNHDIYANNGLTYMQEFYLPHNNADSSERYYSFTWGDALFIALDVITPFDPTTFPVNQADIEDRWWTDFRAGSPQYMWLEDQLRCNDRKWTFIYFHEGPWTNYWGVDYSIPPFLGGDYYQFTGNVMVRQHLVPLFEQYKVDYVLVGHSHLYEKGEKNGVKYITSGSAGDGNVNANIQYANHPEIQLAILDNIYVKFFVNQDSVRFNVINKNNLVIDSEYKTKGYTPFSVQANSQSPTCNGGADGSASLQVQGPRPPYSIQWFDGTTGNTHTGLSAGTYYAYITDQAGCEKVTQVTISDPVFFNPAIQSTQNSPAHICEGQSLNLQCGSFAAYHWSTGEQTPQVQVSTAGAYTVTVTDSLGCSKTSVPFVVVVDTAPSAQFTTGQNGLNYVFTALDGAATSYQWDFGDGTQLTHNQPTIFHTYAQNGTYTITLTVSGACGSNTYTQVISPSVSLQQDDLFPVSVYPNPAGDLVWVEAEALSRIQLYDISGKRLLDRNYSAGNRQSIDLSACTAGIYWLQITGAKGTTIRKISVQ